MSRAFALPLVVALAGCLGEIEARNGGVPHCPDDKLLEWTGDVYEHEVEVLVPVLLKRNWTQVMLEDRGHTIQALDDAGWPREVSAITVVARCFGPGAIYQNLQGNATYLPEAQYPPARTP